MSTRHFSTKATESDKTLVEALFSAEAPSETDYKLGMHDLGVSLGEKIFTVVEQKKRNVCIACTVEDADFLGAGVLEVLEKCPGITVTFACFWNEKSIDCFGMDEFDISPILRSYKEPTASDCILVVAKSIISGGCVVATNILNLVSDLSPIEILIVAPVMVKGAERKLRNHFSKELVDRFEYVFLAEDEDRGSGKSVYERYGWKGSKEKNRYTPDIVKTRRKRFASSSR